jgi:RNA polymerase sigma-70 factor (ECF subfamily)
MIKLKADFRTDRDLIAAVLKGYDEQAFRSLYRRHTPRLLGFVSRLLSGTNSEEEDVVQETWIRACENLTQFQWRPTFSTSLLGIGLNVVHDYLRRNKRSRIMTENYLLGLPSKVPDQEAQIDLDWTIRRLPDQYRLVLVLHDIEGFAHQEIAERLNIPAGTTKSQLFRARRMIREWLSERKGVKT